MIIAPLVSRSRCATSELSAALWWKARTIILALIPLLPSWAIAQTTSVTVPLPIAPVLAASDAVLPDAPSASRVVQSNSFAGGLGSAAKTIGSDELYFLKWPFKKSSIKWDVLFLGATGVLIANDESVLYQVPASWHSSSNTLSNAALGTTAGTAAAIFVSGLVTGDDHAKETGIRSAEAAVDSTILFGAAKAIFARQRPLTGEGEGKFFSGNWAHGSFPSGHATLTWAVASTVAHEYHSPWVAIAMYGLGITVSTSRVTAGQHFPADVFAGSVLGYGVGTYVAHKPGATNSLSPSKSMIRRLPDAILEHVSIRGQ